MDSCSSSSVYLNLTDNEGKLISRDGNKTANILDALPVGCRISEYQPPPAEQEKWAAEIENITAKNNLTPMSTSLSQRAVFWAVSLGLIILIAAFVIPFVGRVSASARRSVDASNIRQLGQACIIYASDHDDNLPLASDVWDYARILAEVINDASFWVSKNDPAADEFPELPREILGPGSKPRPLHPDFRKLKPSIAVALGRLNTRMPATTPILWTRGLQPDGTWSASSPYGQTGGWIMFLGGNVAFYKTLADGEGELLRYGGKGQTANILEALPPGTRIGEYTPTEEEKTAWAKSVVWRQKMGQVKEYTPLLFLAALWLPFVAISVYRLAKKQRGALTVLLWPVVFTVLLFLILPGCW